MSNIRMATLALAASVSFVAVADAQTQYVPPYNLVVVLLDSSISFQVPINEPGLKGRIPIDEAMQVVQRLFDASAAERRRRNVAEDRYVIVAVDAASQVIWRGDRKALTALNGEELGRILQVRRQFAYCTDYEAGTNTAARVMRENPDATDFYVLTFGDLIHEPPTTSYRACAKPSGTPPANIDWDTLQYASLGFYFVSTDFNLRPNQRWPELLESRGIHAEFKDMAQTMTQALELPPPPRAVYRPTQEQLDDAQEKWTRLKEFGAGAMKVLVRVTAVGVLALFGFIYWLRRRTGTKRATAARANTARATR